MAEAKKKPATKKAEEAEEIIVTEVIDDKEKATAKAGKRSTKAGKVDDDLEVKPKKVQKPARSKLERSSKGYKKISELVDKSKVYSLKEAMEVATKTSYVKFDASVELHIRLNVDPKQADQNIRGTVILPAGSGKTSRVAVFAEADDAAKAKKAGADFAGNEELLTKLDKEIIDFDVLISTPVLMARLGKYAKLLGPKGLMPNPKSGTVTTDVAKAVTEAKAGRVEYRIDSTGIIHVAIGKVSFGADKLEQNAQAILSALKQAKPASIKGAFVNSIFAATTMGPSIKLDPSVL